VCACVCVCVQRELASNDAVGVARPDVISNSDDVTMTAGAPRSSYVHDYDNYDHDRPTEYNSRRPSSDREEIEEMEELEIDSGHGTSVDHGTDVTGNSYRASFAADADTTTMF